MRGGRRLRQLLCMAVMPESVWVNAKIETLEHFRPELESSKTTSSERLLATNSNSPVFAPTCDATTAKPAGYGIAVPDLVFFHSSRLYVFREHLASVGNFD